MKSPSYDIIIFASPRWDGPYSSTTFSLAKEMARTHRVFYIDNPFTYKDFYRKRHTEAILSRKEIWKGKKSNVQLREEIARLFYVVTSPLLLPINWLWQGKLYNLLSAKNEKKLHRLIVQIIEQYSINSYIFINSFNPNYLRKLKLKMPPLLHIYQTVDDISQEPYIAKHGVRLEKEAMKAAQLVLTTSSELLNKARQLNKKSHCLPNAANVALFRRALETDFEIPEELKNINNRIICYIGNIGFRLNYEILKKICAEIPDVTLLMIGPVGTNDCEKSGLTKLENVIFTGSQPLEKLPVYLKHAHCGIIPFLCNQLTKSIYPLKVNEYLAAGVSVVSTGFSEDIRTFKEVIRISNNEDEFVHNVRAAIEETSERQKLERSQYATQNSWSARVEQFWNILDRALTDKTLDQ